MHVPIRYDLLRFCLWCLLLSIQFPALRLLGQEETKSLFPLDQSWRYNQTSAYADQTWAELGFDDSALPQSPGLFAAESGNPFVTARLRTRLQPGRSTYYFRTSFLFTNSPVGITLVCSNLIDDGAVFYLNGREVKRLRLPEPPIPIQDETVAVSHEVTAFEVFYLSGPLIETNLFPGVNVLAVEVHQAPEANSDVVFGMSLTAVLPDPRQPSTLKMPQEPRSEGLRFVNAFDGLSFINPVAISSPPGETNRLFVVEQAGQISVVTNLANPNRSTFLNISGRIISGGEQGLLGLAFHPGYATNRQFFLFYTTRSTTAQGTNALHDRLSRMRTSPDDPNSADPTTEEILFEQYDEASNHNGGDLHFGPDGYLYVSLGDEGSGNDAFLNSQRIDRDFFAGLLRIDVDARATSLPANPHPANQRGPETPIPYRIPADNPWIGATEFNGRPVDPSSVRTEFYAVGLRNPWRFSFDSLTGELYLADVGQGVYEEVNLVRKGGNYGWSFREGLHPGPRVGPPAGVSFDGPIAEYIHGSGPDRGNSITGGLVYRGSRIPSLYGAYVFSDYVSGNVWALRATGTNTVPFTRLTGDTSIAGFGVDPRNGDILSADQSEDQIKRLVSDPGTSVGSALPPTLLQTGAFTNLHQLTDPTMALTPNTGVQPYEINVPFWSDHALKSRWVFRSNPNLKIQTSINESWNFPTGTVWVKHFDLELTNGVPESKRRLETRLLVRNSAGVYGVTYRWGGSLTNASLVPESGLEESFLVHDGGTTRTQVWRYPSRSECVACHTPAAGYALGFGTAQLNRDTTSSSSGATQNQLAQLQSAGYFSTPFPNPEVPPRLAHATNEAWSVEWRVRSYLSANCASCHRPGGTALGQWDARAHVPLSQAGIVNGALTENSSSDQDRVVVPGSEAHSMLLQRISTRGPRQMPPLGSTVQDLAGIRLLAHWITNELPRTVDFDTWQFIHFVTTESPPAGRHDDPDGDGRDNWLEWLSETDPNNAASRWEVTCSRVDDKVELEFPHPANRAVQVEFTSNLDDPSSWRLLDVPSNRFLVPAQTLLRTVEDAHDGSTARFYRAVISDP